MDLLLTEDSRTPIQKLRRHQLQKICKDNDIKFDPSGPAERLIQLIEGSGVNILRNDLFQKVTVQDESGRTKEIIDPIVKPHATANKVIDHDSIIEAKSKEDEFTKLTREYRQIYGKAPHGKMKIETLREKVDAKS